MNLQEEDLFDLLPDALILEIFNKLQDAKSLSACMSLCKRFRSLVPQTDALSLTISRRKTPPEPAFKGFIGRAIYSPIQTFIHRMITKKSTACSRCTNHHDDVVSFTLPNDMLKNFKEIRSLAVKLPGHDGDSSPENGSGSGALLKWSAEFGRELESCVVLGATAFRKMDSEDYDEKEGSAMSENLTNKQLKKRVVWTILCMIASSTRHHMLKNIISSHRTIRAVEISDGSKQGMIRMTDRQVVDLRAEMESPAAVEPEFGMDRTKVPAVVIKMWYVPVLELPESGCVMKEATLAVIRPLVEDRPETTAAAVVEEDDDDVGLAMGAFGDEDEEWVVEAVRRLVKKKRAYTLEMNSF